MEQGWKTQGEMGLDLGNLTLIQVEAESRPQWASFAFSQDREIIYRSIYRNGWSLKVNA